MGAPSATRGWYPDPWGGSGERYWTGTIWTSTRPEPTDPRHNLQAAWAWAFVAAMVALTASCLIFYAQYRPVSSVHSNNPHIESFYRELDSLGFGQMRISDVKHRAREACDGNGLVLWGEGNYSMADSFQFATAAGRVCNDL